MSYFVRIEKKALVDIRKLIKSGKKGDVKKLELITVVDARIRLEK